MNCNEYVPGGATVEWKGDILDFPSLTEDEMKMSMEVTVTCHLL